MNLAMMFISSILMTILGFLTYRLVGFNLVKMISDLVLYIGLVIPYLAFVFGPKDIQAFMVFMKNYVAILTNLNMWLGIIIGDIVGTIFAMMTKPSERSF